MCTQKLFLFLFFLKSICFSLNYWLLYHITDQKISDMIYLGYIFYITKACFINRGVYTFHMHCMCVQIFKFWYLICYLKYLNVGLCFDYLDNKTVWSQAGSPCWRGQISQSYCACCRQNSQFSFSGAETHVTT